MGVNAGIQTPWIVHYAKQAITPGDNVIFALEYPLYHFDRKLNHVALSYSLSNPDILMELEPKSLISIFWGSSLKRVYEGYIGLPKNFDLSKGLYGPHNLNERGDQMNNMTNMQASWMSTALSTHSGENYSARFITSPPNTAPWQDLANKVKQQGGCIVFIPPALMHHPRYEQEPEKSYYDTLTQRLYKNGIELTGKPQDYFYPTTYFFDTNYHLTHEARKIHTMRVIQLLTDFKNCIHSNKPDS
jgi:hypothetical protein